LYLEKKSLGSQFLPLPCEIHAFDTDKIGVDVLIKAKRSPHLVISNLENVEVAVERLIGLIDIVYDYVNKVLEGKIAANSKIGRFLADAVAALPKFDTTSADKIFNNNLQDLLMVVYLANLTRTQLSLAEKLQRIGVFLHEFSQTKLKAPMKFQFDTKGIWRLSFLFQILE